MGILLMGMWYVLFSSRKFVEVLMSRVRCEDANVGLYGGEESSLEYRLTPYAFVRCSFGEKGSFLCFAWTLLFKRAI
jgi:hypothetical protein